MRWVLASPPIALTPALPAASTVLPCVLELVFILLHLEEEQALA